MSAMARAAPFIHDRPAAEALAAWEEACAEAGCPERVEIVRLPLDQAVGRVTTEPVWAKTSSPPFDASAMDGIAVHAADTVGASETAPVRIEEGGFHPRRRTGHQHRDQGGVLGDAGQVQADHRQRRRRLRISGAQR